MGSKSLTASECTGFPQVLMKTVFQSPLILMSKNTVCVVCSHVSMIDKLAISLKV